MSNNFFDSIEQEITLLQEYKTALKAENEDLRRQLTSLRNGQNILIDIQGQRFSFSYSADTSVNTPIPVHTSIPAHTPIPAALSEQLSIPAATQKSNKQTTILPIETTASTYNSTIAAQITSTYNTTPSIKFTPAPVTTPLVETASEYNTTPSAESVAEVREAEPEKKNTPPQPTFLEEIMLDEFAAAATNPTAVWTGPIKKLEKINEDQKAALRRELMGSFLLE